MKKLLFVMTLPLLISSCVTTYGDFDNETKKARSNETNYFVIKKDGQRITGSDIKVSYAAAKIDGQRIKIEDVATYQTSKAYVTSVKIGKYSTVFANRLRQGKISLYYYDGVAPGSSSNNQNTAYYILDKGGVFIDDYNKFPDAIRENKEALDKFFHYFPNGKVPFVMSEKKKLLEMIDVIETYNR